MNIRHLAVAYHQISRRMQLENGTVGFHDSARWDASGAIRAAFWDLAKALKASDAMDVWFSAADEVEAETRIN